MAFQFGAKIRAMLDTATSFDNQADAHAGCATCDAGTTNHPAEMRAAASTYRTKAEDLMRQYRIAEEEALAADIAAAVPIKVRVEVAGRRYSDLSMYVTTITTVIADHCGVRARVVWERDGDVDKRVTYFVGYEGDVRYAEYLWTGAYLMFSTLIDPEWDRNLPEEENIWRLRNAGIERRVIADKAWGWPAGKEAKNRSKVQRGYLRECARRGVEARATGLSHQTEVYRDAYARSFVQTLSDRLQNAVDGADSAGGGITLHGRKERVDEAFYGFFPEMRPKPRTAETFVATTTECERCKTNKSGGCRKHPAVKGWTQADERRWQSRNNSPSARAGTESGRHAAEGVHITRGAGPRANRLDESGRAIEG